jgi:hypothetical protein
MCLPVVDCRLVDADTGGYLSLEEASGPVFAVGTRTHWDKDLDVIRQVQNFRGWLGDSVAVIDATRPLEGEFPIRNEVPLEAMKKESM